MSGRRQASDVGWLRRTIPHTRRIRMRVISLALLLLVALAACSDMRHPGVVVGTWARDSLYGDGLVRGTDTLRLTRDGIALRSGSIAATDPASSSIKPAVWAEALKWTYKPRAEGHLLCLFVAEGYEQECHTVRIASDSELVIDDRSYRRLPAR